MSPRRRGEPPRAALRRWLWAAAVVAIGALAFFAVQGPFRLLAAAGVVTAVLSLVRPRRGAGGPPGGGAA